MRHFLNIVDFLERTALFAAVMLLLLLAYVAPAGAAEVDLQPLADTGVQILVAALSAVGAIVAIWIRKKVNDWLDIQLDEKSAATLQSAINYGINWGAEKIRERYNGKLTISMKNELLAMGASYVVSKTPDALRRFNIDPSSDSGRAALKDLVEARLTAWVFDDDPRNQQPQQVPISQPVADESPKP